MRDMETPGGEARRSKAVIAGGRDGSEHSAKALKSQGVRVAFEGGDGPVTLTLRGRMLWTLRELAKAGARGVTPLERPAPRWSHYVFALRALGLAIETIREDHGGPFPGRHGRYVLRSRVTLEGGGHE